MTITEWQPSKRNPAVESFFKRPAFSRDAEATAEAVLREIQESGDEAVLKYAEKFDGSQLDAAGMRVPEQMLRDAVSATDLPFRRAVKEARRRIQGFAKAGMPHNWQMSVAGGGRMGERFVPLDRVGIYVPGGAAPLASTALMTATLAKVAGVPEIVLCTPCDRQGIVNPFLLYAAVMAGATELYRVGGIQAVGMMAYGTRRVRKVQKIVGPGGAFVTAAKRQVYGVVALDLVAGPSEIAVLADQYANPAFAAADLLSQIEHGTGHEKALLVTDSKAFASAVKAEIDKQLIQLSREKIMRQSLRSGILLVTVNSLEDGVAVCNRFAPEHLEVMVRKPRSLLPSLRCAGAIFLGSWTPESAGDFVAGPSHVLPTGGSAAMFSGLTVGDFLRRSSVIQYSRNDLRAALPVIESFGRIEGLDAHARAARIRFENERGS